MLVPGARDRHRGPTAAPRPHRRACGSCPLAARPAFRPEAAAGAAQRGACGSGSGARYAVYAGRYDARQDLPTLLDALARARRGAGRRRRGSVAPTAPWPPRVCLVGRDARRPRRAVAGRGPRGRRGRDGLCPASCRPTGSRRSSPGRGSSSSPSAPRRAGSSRSRRSRPGVPVVASAVGRPARGRRAGRDPRRARRPGPPRDGARAAWADDDLHAQLVAARRGASRDERDLGGRRAGDASGVGGRRPAGAVALAGAAARRANSPARLLRPAAPAVAVAAGGRRARRDLALP